METDRVSGIDPELNGNPGVSHPMSVRVGTIGHRDHPVRRLDEGAVVGAEHGVSIGIGSSHRCCDQADREGREAGEDEALYFISSGGGKSAWRAARGRCHRIRHLRYWPPPPPRPKPGPQERSAGSTAGRRSSAGPIDRWVWVPTRWGGGRCHGSGVPFDFFPLCVKAFGGWVLPGWAPHQPSHRTTGPAEGS